MMDRILMTMDLKRIVVIDGGDAKRREVLLDAIPMGLQPLGDS